MDDMSVRYDEFVTTKDAFFTEEDRSDSCFIGWNYQSIEKIIETVDRRKSDRMYRMISHNGITFKLPKKAMPFDSIMVHVKDIEIM